MLLQCARRAHLSGATPVQYCAVRLLASDDKPGLGQAIKNTIGRAPCRCQLGALGPLQAALLLPGG
jgi:hypothetical protein